MNKNDVDKTSTEPDASLPFPSSDEEIRQGLELNKIFMRLKPCDREKVVRYARSLES